MNSFFVIHLKIYGGYCAPSCTFIACLFFFFFVLWFLMRLLIPTSLKRRRNGFPVDTYCPWCNKTEMQRSVDQIYNYYFTLSNGFQLFFALIFISVPLLASIIARVCTRCDVLCVNVEGLCELCVWGRMTAPYYVHRQLLEPNSSQLTHGVALRSCILEMPCSSPGRDSDCRDWGFTAIPSANFRSLPEIRQQIPRFWCSPKFYNITNIHRFPLLVCSLSQHHPFLFMIYFSIILPSTLMSSKWCLFFVFPTRSV